MGLETRLSDWLNGFYVVELFEGRFMGDNQENQPKESSMKPWIIYMVIFGAIFMLLMAGRKGSENSEEISFMEFMDAVTNKVGDTDILIEANIKFSQSSELKEISGTKKKTIKTGTRFGFARKNSKIISATAAKIYAARSFVFRSICGRRNRSA